MRDFQPRQYVRYDFAEDNDSESEHPVYSFMDLAELLNIPPKALSLNGMLGVAIGAQGSGKAAAHFVPGVNEINLTRTGGAGAIAHEWAMPSIITSEIRQT